MTELYRAYDRAGVLLYIGVTDNFGLRMNGHNATSDWAALAERIERKTFSNREHALAVEDRAIRRLRPVFNVISQVDKADRWGSNVAVAQYLHDRYVDRINKMHEAMATVSEEEIEEYLERFAALNK